MWKQWLRAGCALVLLTMVSGCGTLRTEHDVRTQHKVEPIEININIKHEISIKMQETVKDVFKDLDQQDVTKK